MKRNYQSKAQKRQAKRREKAEAARNSLRLSSWRTRPETSKADEQEVTFVRQKLLQNLLTLTVSTIVPMKKIPILLKIDQTQLSKNDDFPTIIVNTEIKKQLLQQVPNNLKNLSLKIRSKAVVSF